MHAAFSSVQSFASFTVFVSSAQTLSHVAVKSSHHRKRYRCHVCEHSAAGRGALDWLRNTICSGPPSSQPSDPVRVGHQWLHQSHRLRFHRGVYWCNTCGQVAQQAAEKRSRVLLDWSANALVFLTRAGRDVLARKASADWPLMRDTVSVNNL